MIFNKKHFENAVIELKIIERLETLNKFKPILKILTEQQQNKIKTMIKEYKHLKNKKIKGFNSIEFKKFVDFDRENTIFINSLI